MAVGSLNNKSKSESSVDITQTMELLFDIVLWVAYVGALAASFTHVVWAFNYFEPEGSKWVGYVAALAVDIGLAGLSYSIQMRKASDRNVWPLWIGIVTFATISMFANSLHAISVTMEASRVTPEMIASLDWVEVLRVVMNSASLPLLVVYLGETVRIPGSSGLISSMKQTILQLTEERDKYQTAVSSMNEKVKLLNDTESRVKELEAGAKKTERILEQRDLALNASESKVANLESSLLELKEQYSILNRRLTSVNSVGKYAILYLSRVDSDESYSLSDAAREASKESGVQVSESTMQRVVKMMRP